MNNLLFKDNFYSEISIPKILNNLNNIDKRYVFIPGFIHCYMCECN